MPSDPTDPRHPSHRTAAAQAVAGLLARVAEERGLDFEPAPVPVIDALPGLTRVVQEVAGRCGDELERRWLAAALAALSHHVQAGTLPEPLPAPDPSSAPDLLPRPAEATEATEAVVAVVTSPLGVLAGRRRDGIPRWVFPGGTVEEGETARQAAVRECAEETGLAVAAEHEIGRRTHPVTGQRLSYIACTPTAGHDVRAVAPDELVEVRWLNPTQVHQLMPDLFDAVRDYLDDQPPCPEAFKTFAKSGNWGGVETGVRHIQTYGTGWGGYVLIEVDDPEAFGRYQAHHNQTYGAAVVVTFEPLFDVDKAAEETIAALRLRGPAWRAGRPPPRQPGLLISDRFCGLTAVGAKRGFISRRGHRREGGARVCRRHVGAGRCDCQVKLTKIANQGKVIPMAYVDRTDRPRGGGEWRKQNWALARTRGT